MQNRKRRSNPIDQQDPSKMDTKKLKLFVLRQAMARLNEDMEQWIKAVEYEDSELIDKRLESLQVGLRMFAWMSTLPQNAIEKLCEESKGTSPFDNVIHDQIRRQSERN